ncbi:hypothetical protein DWZ08_04155 [Clostridiaceae bacterium AF29-16BH]|nr:hypothetical protein DWZ08_04155 [Clostridiaceae bacterium AF29-16BH]
MALKEDYKDAVFAGLRKYKMLDNGDGTVSPVDMTEYETAGDKFGAKDVNAITKMVNCTGDAFDPERDYEVGDYAIHENTVWKFTTAHPAGAWDESHVEKTRILVEIAEQNKNFAELDEKLEVDKIIMNAVLVTFVNGVGTVTYDGKGYSKAICTANFMADAAYPSGYHIQLGVNAANGIINFYTSSTTNTKTYVSYILGLKK